MLQRVSKGHPFGSPRLVKHNRSGTTKVYSIASRWAVSNESWIEVDWKKSGLNQPIIGGKSITEWKGPTLGRVGWVKYSWRAVRSAKWNKVRKRSSDNTGDRLSGCFGSLYPGRSSLKFTLFFLLRLIFWSIWIEFQNAATAREPRWRPLTFQYFQVTIQKRLITFLDATYAILCSFDIGTSRGKAAAFTKTEHMTLKPSVERCGRRSFFLLWVLAGFCPSYAPLSMKT